MSVLIFGARRERCRACFFSRSQRRSPRDVAIESKTLSHRQRRLRRPLEPQRAFSCQPSGFVLRKTGTSFCGPSIVSCARQTRLGCFFSSTNLMLKKEKVSCISGVQSRRSIAAQQWYVHRWTFCVHIGNQCYDCHLSSSPTCCGP